MRQIDDTTISYSGLREGDRETMRLYIEYGVEPGSCFTAILSNDLRAVVMADERTFQALPQIYRWLVNHAPSQAWGSAEEVRKWMNARREERKAQQK